MNDTVPLWRKWCGLFIDGDCLAASSQSPSIASDAGEMLGKLGSQSAGQLESDCVHDGAKERKDDDTMNRNPVTTWRR